MNKRHKGLAPRISCPSTGRFNPYPASPFVILICRQGSPILPFGKMGIVSVPVPALSFLYCKLLAQFPIADKFLRKFASDSCGGQNFLPG